MVISCIDDCNALLTGTLSVATSECSQSSCASGLQPTTVSPQLLPGSAPSALNNFIGAHTTPHHLAKLCFCRHSNPDYFHTLLSNCGTTSWVLSEQKQHSLPIHILEDTVFQRAPALPPAHIFVLLSPSLLFISYFTLSQKALHR